MNKEEYCKDVEESINNIKNNIKRYEVTELFDKDKSDKITKVKAEYTVIEEGEEYNCTMLRWYYKEDKLFTLYGSSDLIEVLPCPIDEGFELTTLKEDINQIIKILKNNDNDSMHRYFLSCLDNKSEYYKNQIIKSEEYNQLINLIQKPEYIELMQDLDNTEFFCIEELYKIGKELGEKIIHEDTYFSMPCIKNKNGYFSRLSWFDYYNFVKVSIDVKFKEGE